jgi:hypothetical protein
MNALIYTENNELMITKPNGLHYKFDNVDKPELGFDYDVLVYAEEELKILNWDVQKEFPDQEQIPLSADEKDAVETYIKNSEPPMGVTLNGQYIEQLAYMCNKNVEACAGGFNFSDIAEVVYVGREGSNHPYRSNARRVMEYADALWHIFDQVMNEIVGTREDTLRDFASYVEQLPQPQSIPETDNHQFQKDTKIGG